MGRCIGKSELRRLPKTHKPTAFIGSHPSAERQPSDIDFRVFLSSFGTMLLLKIFICFHNCSRIVVTKPWRPANNDYCDDRYDDKNFSVLHAGGG